MSFCDSCPGPEIPLRLRNFEASIFAALDFKATASLATWMLSAKAKVIFKGLNLPKIAMIPDFSSCLGTSFVSTEGATSVVAAVVFSTLSFLEIRIRQ